MLKESKRLRAFKTEIIDLKFRSRDLTKTPRERYRLLALLADKLADYDRTFFSEDNRTHRLRPRAPERPSPPL